MEMTAAGGGRALQSEINVTPMVDIMLVLLIIFMVVAPFLQPGITVPVPKNMRNPDVDMKISSESAVVISIPNDFDYYLGKKPVRKEQVAEEVQRLLAKNRNDQDRIVYIKSGTGVTYGVVVNVINEVKKAGVDKIGLVADKKQKDSTPQHASS